MSDFGTGAFKIDDSAADGGLSAYGAASDFVSVNGLLSAAKGYAVQQLDADMLETGIDHVVDDIKWGWENHPELVVAGVGAFGISSVGLGALALRYTPVETMIFKGGGAVIALGAGMDLTTNVSRMLASDNTNDVLRYGFKSGLDLAQIGTAAWQMFPQSRGVAPLVNLGVLGARYLSAFLLPEPKED